VLSTPPAIGRSVNDNVATTGILATKWLRHAQWARPAGQSF